jgi:hypothetical protein
LGLIISGYHKLFPLAILRHRLALESISLELNHQAGADVYSALIQRRALAESHVENAILA